MRDLPPQALRFGARASALQITESGVGPILRRAGEDRETVRARQVIGALPPRMLAATLRLDPAPPPGTLQRRQETPTWMAPHAKVFAIYDRPFWRDAGVSAAAQRMGGPMVEIHDATPTSGRAPYIRLPRSTRTGPTIR